MRQRSPIRSVRRATLAVMGVASVAVLVFTLRSGYAASPLVEAAGQEEAVRIEFTLDEYSFSPDPLRIPAGRPVTLVIRNVGRFQHEFMAGRNAAGDDFEHDLFADLHVNIEKAETAEADHASAADRDQAAHEQAQAEHAHAAAEHEPGAAGGHAHGEGMSMGPWSRTSPARPSSCRSRYPSPGGVNGARPASCRAHYDAGMHGALIVE